MIFVTVGSMVPFDRLVMAMDSCASTNPSEEVFVQIGAGSCIPKSMRFARMSTPVEFDHQLHTVKWLKDRPGVYVATDKDELGVQISRAIAKGQTGATLLPSAPEPFVTKLRNEFLQ